MASLSVKRSTLLGETFASPKTREFFWINFRDLTNLRNFARKTFANGEIEKILRDKLSRIAIFSFEIFYLIKKKGKKRLLINSFMSYK